MRDERDLHQHSTWPGYGLLLGAALGAVFGIVADQFALGMSAGAGIGLVAGAAIDGIVRRQR